MVESNDERSWDIHGECVSSGIVDEVQGLFVILILVHKDLRFPELAGQDQNKPLTATTGPKISSTRVTAFGFLAQND